MYYDLRAWTARGPATHEFEKAAPYIDHGTDRLNPERYFSKSWAALEWDKLFTKTWLLAGPECDLRESGDFIRYQIGLESFIVVRDNSGTIRAHYNVCPHRGSRLVVADNGSLDQLTCPFHSWKFSLDGKCTSVTDRDTYRPEVLKHDCDLTSVRCEVAAGLVFITMNDAAPPLRAWLAPLLSQLEQYDIDKMNVIQHRRVDWAANWKMGVDAFYEAYHLHAIHPQTMTMMDDRTHIDLYAGGFSRQIVPFGQPSSHFNDQLAINPVIASMLEDAGVDPARVKPGTSRKAMADGKRDRAKKMGLDYDRFSDPQLTDALLYGIFPNVQVVCHPEAVFIHRFLPHIDDPNKSLYETMILYRHVDAPGYKAPQWMGLDPEADLSGAIRPQVVHTHIGEPPGLGEVLDQDTELVSMVQEGVRSRGFRGALLSEQEVRLRHFHAEIARWIAK